MIAFEPLLASLGMPRNGDRTDATAKTRKKNSSIIVAATAAHLRGAPVIDLTTLDALVDVAKKYETMIVEIDSGDQVEFLLWDDGMVFRFVDEEASALLSDPTPAPSAVTLRWDDDEDTGDVPIPSPPTK